MKIKISHNKNIYARIRLKNIYAISFYIFFLFSYAYSAFEYKEISAKSASLGGIQTVLLEEPLCVFYNPANLISANKNSLQTSYTRLFNIKELAHNSCSVVLPIYKNNKFSIGYESFGKSEIYKEETFVLGYGFRVMQCLSMGLNIKNMKLKIPSENNEFGETNICGIDMGFYTQCSQYLNMGLCVRNINRPRIGKSSPEEIYRDFTLGYSYTKLKDIKLYFESFKVVGYKLGLRYGAEYKLCDYFLLRTGLQNNPNYYAAGFGIKFLKIILDYSYRYHTQLGDEHLVSVGFYL
jgi:hypothetical protein